MPGSPEFRLLGTTPRGPNSVGTQTRTGAAEFLWSETGVVVDADDIADLEVTLRPALTVSGRFEFRGSAALPTEAQMNGMAVGLGPIDTAPRAVAPGFAVAGRFTTAPYPPGRYELQVRQPNNTWRVESILVGGHEYYDRYIELTDQRITDVVVVPTIAPYRCLGP
jgi:hypothetical protein